MRPKEATFDVGDRVRMTEIGRRTMIHTRSDATSGIVVGFSRRGCVRVKRDERKTVRSYAIRFWEKCEEPTP